MNGAVPLSTFESQAVALQSGELGGLLLPVVQLAVGLLQIAGARMVFQKAERAGWKALIPIYNLYVMLRIGESAWWWLLLLVVPVVNLYAAYKIHRGVAGAFGPGVGFGLGLPFLGVVVFPLLGFGDYQYRRPETGV